MKELKIIISCNKNKLIRIDHKKNNNTKTNTEISNITTVATTVSATSKREISISNFNPQDIQPVLLHYHFPKSLRDSINQLKLSTTQHTYKTKII